MIAAEHLDDVADHLIGHFVDQARRSGASWTEIGRCMGVTKQAAQKRFVGKEQAPAARAAGSAVIASPHLVLGLLTEPYGLAAQAITAQHVALDSVRETVAATLPPPGEQAPS